jgi:hypothetical protein
MQNGVVQELVNVLLSKVFVRLFSVHPKGRESQKGTVWPLPLG